MLKMGQPQNTLTQPPILLWRARHCQWFSSGPVRQSSGIRLLLWAVKAMPIQCSWCLIQTANHGLRCLICQQVVRSCLWDYQHRKWKRALGHRWGLRRFGGDFQLWLNAVVYGNSSTCPTRCCVICCHKQQHCRHGWICWNGGLLIDTGMEPRDQQLGRDGATAGWDKKILCGNSGWWKIRGHMFTVTQWIWIHVSVWQNINNHTCHNKRRGVHCWRAETELVLYFIVCDKERSPCSCLQEIDLVDRKL